MARAARTRDGASRRSATATTGPDHRQALLVLLVGMAVLVVVAWSFTGYAVKILSGGRAYVHGEGRWSKAQQEAVFFLDRYAERGEATDLARARRALAVPLGDRQARLALLGSAHDPDAARTGFLRGENHPNDVPTMMWMLENFETAPYLRDAIRIWASADEDILRLRDIGDRLERQWSRGEPSLPDMAAIRADLARTDQRLRNHETEFSATLNEGLRLLELAVLLASALLMAALFVLSLLMFRWATRRIRSSEQKFWTGFAHAPMGFALLSRDGRCTEVNDALCKLVGLERSRLVGEDIGDVLEPDDRPGLERALKETVDTEHRVETRCRHADGDRIWTEVRLCPLPLSRDRAETFTLLINDISQERHDRERLTWEASHDSLTGLFNRNHFERELDSVLERRNDASQHVLAFIDLDRFKPINDTCGHLAGDEVLKSLAALMRERLRASDLLARIGGDEFAFLLQECPLQRGQVIAESIRAAIRQAEFRLDGGSFSVTASIGLIAINNTADSADSVLRHADEACYGAKQSGGDQVHIGATTTAGT